MTARTCLRCGSDRIIPNVPMLDRFGFWDFETKSQQVEVHGNPKAWLFKDTVAGQLVAFICGACGHTELKTQGFLKLYAKYQESQRPPTTEAPTAEGEGLQCMACGESIPAEATQCRSCGWTWGEGRDTATE